MFADRYNLRFPSEAEILEFLNFDLPENVGESESQTKAPAEPVVIEDDVLKDLHILVVEDKAANRELIKSFLAPHPFHLLEAENGREGVEKALAHSPDLILMDIKMPGMDGHTVLKKIRERSVRSNHSLRKQPPMKKLWGWFACRASFQMFTINF